MLAQDAHAMKEAPMNRASFYVAALVCGALITPTAAADLKLLPAETTLSGPHATQRLLVLSDDGGRIVGDVTSKATFASSNPAVVTVDKSGTVRAVGDGEAVITASDAGKQVTARVKVGKTKEPFTWSFRNHVIPMLTKAGCNSGACHGA